MSALLVLVLGVACVAVVFSGSPEETSGADPGEGSEGGAGEAEEATTFDESGVYLIEDDGDRHSSTTTLADDSLFLEQINPGNEVSGTAVVDVPEGIEIDSVEIEDIGSLEGPLVIEMP